MRNAKWLERSLLLLLLLLLTGASLAAWAEITSGADGAPTRSSWGNGGQADGVDPEARRAYWRQRAAERGLSEQVGTARAGGQAGSHGHGGTVPGKAAALTATPNRGAVMAAAASGRLGGGGGRDGVLWLTDMPNRRDGKRGGGMNGMGAAGGGVPMKRVWLRVGANPTSARPATAEESALVQGPDGKRREIKVEPHGGPYNVQFPVPEPGYYNVYLTRRALEGDTLNVTVAKAEVTSGSMGHGMPREEAARLVSPRTEAGVPAEIVRARKSKEELFTRINYGDEITFQVLRAGKPAQNARVTFTSGQGWSNSAQSDEDGRVVFTVIRDYYTKDWSLFDKRHRENYVVSASFSTPEAGDHQGGHYASTRYTATLSGAYYPGSGDYESYASGLMLGGAGLLFTGTSVWAWRRRRVRPYKEVRFDE